MFSTRESIIHLINLYIVPVVCSIGVLFELASFITFYKITKFNKSRIYKYLFSYSLSDTIVLFISIIYGILNCGEYCNSWKYMDSYTLKQFDLYFKIYITNILYSFNVLIELEIALSRLKTSRKHHTSSSNKKYYKKSNKKKSFKRFLYFSSAYSKIMLLLVLSVLINIPYLSIYEIIKVEDYYGQNNSSFSNKLNSTIDLVRMNITGENDDANTHYVVHPNLKSVTRFTWLVPLAIVYFLKDFLLLIFIITLNILVTVSVKRKYKEMSRSLRENNDLKKSYQSCSLEVYELKPKPYELDLESQLIHTSDEPNPIVNSHDRNLGSRLRYYNNKERRVALMITCLSIVFLIGHLPETFYKLTKKLNIILNNSYMYLDYFLLIANFISFFSSFLNFFIYYNFSHMFKSQFRKLFTFKFKSIKEPANL